MIVIKKNKKAKDFDELKGDVRRGYEALLTRCKQIGHELYLITIERPRMADKEIGFNVTNRLMNNVRKSIDGELNYLFMIEVGELISRGNFELEDLEFHVHIVVSTVNISTVKHRIDELFDDADVQVDRITDRDDKVQLVEYLLKQANANPTLFQGGLYNFKVMTNHQ